MKNALKSHKNAVECIPSLWEKSELISETPKEESPVLPPTCFYCGAHGVLWSPLCGPSCSLYGRGSDWVIHLCIPST